MYGHITKFSGMGRFTYPWCFAGASFASARGPLIFENMKCNAYVCCSFMLNVFSFMKMCILMKENYLSRLPRLQASLSLSQKRSLN